VVYRPWFRRAKVVLRVEKKMQKHHVLKSWMFSLKYWRLLLELGWSEGLEPVFRIWIQIGSGIRIPNPGPDPGPGRKK
jgi:hypothetical protein